MIAPQANAIRLRALLSVVFLALVAVQLSAASNSPELATLSGPWQFVAGAYLEEDDPRWDSQSAAVHLPAAWNSAAWPGKESGLADGIGTYRIYLDLDVHDGPWALDWSFAGSAARLWWKGALIHHAGVPGLSPRTEVPAYRPSSIPLESGAGWLVVQVSNFSHLNGGLWAPIQLGPAYKIFLSHKTMDGFTWFCSGILLMIGLFGIATSLYIRWQKTSLWFGLIALVLCVQTLWSGQAVILQLFPDFDWEWFNRIQAMLLFALPVLVVYCIESFFPAPLPRFFSLSVLAVCVVSTVIVTFLPFHLYGYFVYGYAPLAIVCYSFVAKTLIDNYEQAPLASVLCVVGMGLFLALGLGEFFRSVFFIDLPHLVLPGYAILLGTFALAFGYQLGEKKRKRDRTVRQEMAVMFAELRSFDTATKQMPPEEVFRLINGFFEVMGPIIRKHGGFVDKYLGEGVLARFPSGGSAAVHAALDMHKGIDALNLFHEETGLAKLEMGIGLHIGEVLLGTLGELKKMDFTAVSPVVTLASHLEGLARDYQARIVVSPAIIMALDPGTAIEHRFLGFEQIRGFDHPLPVYEIFSADPEETRDHKRESKSELEDALIFFGKREFEQATKLLKSIHLRFPTDPAPLTYLGRIRTIQEKRLLYRLRNPRQKGLVHGTQG